MGIVNAVGVSPEYLLQGSLKTVDAGNLVRDALNTLPAEQQELFKEALIKSMGQIGEQIFRLTKPKNRR